MKDFLVGLLGLFVLAGLAGACADDETPAPPRHSYSSPTYVPRPYLTPDPTETAEPSTVDEPMDVDVDVDHDDDDHHRNSRWCPTRWC